MYDPLESDDQLRTALLEVEGWEKEQNDLWFWEKLGRLPFLLLDKITPKFIQQKLGAAVDEVGSYIQTGGQYLISERSILSKLEHHAGIQAGTLSSGNHSAAAIIPLIAMDRTVDELSSSRANLATIQGATTGIGGIFTLAADIPAILGLSLKIIQEIAIAYGYDPKQKSERIFAVKCLQFASSDIVGKRAILAELSVFGQDKGGQQMLSQLQGWREVVAAYRDNFGWKKLFQLIPIAGILFGAIINRGMLNDVAEASKMLYRKRRIIERLAQSSGQNANGSKAEGAE
ncbi:EcsC family protein [Paenibacillus sp. GCM10023252]|uniref:EcsC family protein n=1 Tax=Paenibacillus sp. GCM10023252 TaxID=3252649 RepID=UPI00361A81FB